MSIFKAKERTRSVVISNDFTRYFSDVIGAPSKCGSPQLIINIDERGGTA
jgi:hypothetical protein